MANASVLPSFPLNFELERKWDVEATKDWLDRSSHHSLYYCAAYVALTRLGVKYMENKSPLRLKPLLILWNVSLAVMSIWGSTRTVSELLHILKNYGFDFSICNSKYSELSPEVVCAVYVFCISKVIELADTMFVILRKQKLIFLHWFHHSSVLIFAWYTSSDRVAMGRWFSSMNYTVHSFMYTYYALRALGVRIPKAYCMLLTLMQIVQMLVGFVINISVLSKWLKGGDCAVSGRVMAMGMSLYSLYFVLFVMFFMNVYLRPKKAKVN